jgi:hypothetical protein
MAGPSHVAALGMLIWLPFKPIFLQNLLNFFFFSWGGGETNFILIFTFRQ